MDRPARSGGAPRRVARRRSPARLDRRHRAASGRGARRLRLGARRLLLDLAEPEDRRHRRVAMDRVRLRVLIRSSPGRAGPRVPTSIAMDRPTPSSSAGPPRRTMEGVRHEGPHLHPRRRVRDGPRRLHGEVLIHRNEFATDQRVADPRERRAGLALRVRNAPGRAAARRHPRVRRSRHAAQPERRPDPAVAAAAADDRGASAARAERVRDRAERHEADVRRVHGGAVRQLPGLRHDRRRVPPVAPHVRQAPAEHRTAGVAAEARNADPGSVGRSGATGRRSARHAARGRGGLASCSCSRSRRRSSGSRPEPSALKHDRSWR